ncbi:HGGxSTG domain-containing protein [Methylobacterium brachiatum]|uniref:HGGxSTG domain-containing protein n=2 Tax=Methylobacterium brachiatum TaxID=269660 RepID=A0ABV1RBJ1_9HYPH
MPSDLNDEPYAPDWRAALALACEAARCGASTRSGCPCQGPAMPNGRCRMHGGGSRDPIAAEGLARSKTSTRTHAGGLQKASL